MFYRVNNDGSVLDYSETKYHKDCLYTDKGIVTAWNGLNYVVGGEPEEPTEVMQARVQKELTDVVQAHLDAEAQKLGYDNCLSVCSYVDTGVAKFDSEGSAFRKWRSVVWDTCYAIVADVQEGSRTIPTAEELIAELPKLKIVYV